MNNLPEVILEVWMPEAKNIIVSKETMKMLFPHQEERELNFSIPRVRKMTLSKESELKIFGDVSPHRTAMFPPLPWGNERYYPKKHAIINEDQAEVYNNHMLRIYSTNLTSDGAEKHFIKAGVVEVFRAAHSVKLTNVTLNPE